MRRLVTPWDLDNIESTSRAIRETMGRTHLFYVVLETRTADSSSNPIDPVFGEPINPFTLGAVHIDRNYIAFSAYINSEQSDSFYGTPGFVTARQIQFEVDPDTQWRQKIVWRVGTLILADGTTYRTTDVERRGFLRTSRILITAEQVT